MVLAKNCPENNKAFTCQTWGKVLGINFDTKNLSWSLPEEKRQKTLTALKKALTNETVTLLELQKLMGRLNHVSQMCPFLNGFRHCLNTDLAKATKTAPKGIQLSVSSKKDLQIWANFLMNENWLPITHPRHSPPLCTKIFVSDAAGFADNSKWDGEIGCGVVGLDEHGDTVLAHQLFWPKSFITETKDSLGKRFGSKLCTLEAIGVILPFLLMPKKLVNQHIVCGVDNMGVVFGWKNKKIKGDTCASIIVKSLHIIEAYLGSCIHVIHAPRVSDWESIAADNLSRERTTGFLEKQMLNRPQNKIDIRVLTDWLKNPREDWTLAERLSNHVLKNM
jgi:hypothetical protein